MNDEKYPGLKDVVMWVSILVMLVAAACVKG